MKMFFLLVFGLLPGLCGFSGPAWAEGVTVDSAEVSLPALSVTAENCAQSTDPAGCRSLEKTQNLYCSIKTVFTSSTGLLLGMLVALIGLWKLLNGSPTAGLMFVAAGALVSALPSLMQSGLNSLGGALGSISTTGGVVPPDQCK